MHNYAPLWETMKRKNVSQYRLLQQGINNKTLYRLRTNQNITVLTMEKLCTILNCEPNDIVAFTK
ncbi:MAG: helix-turn-helix transcriptional regulator [Roseburia sp.]|nr:helix-turn-helix transcriptional regulator [Roseburia sp.]